MTVTPQQKISKALNSSKIPENTLTITFGEMTFTFGEIMFTFGEMTLTLGILKCMFLLLGGFGTLWVGGPGRVFFSNFMCAFYKFFLA